MTKYTCNNGYSSFYERADSLTELRRNLMRKLYIVNGRAMFSVSHGNKKDGVLIWDLNSTGKVYWFLEAEESKNIWGFKVKKPFRSYEVYPDGTLGKKRTYN